MSSKSAITSAMGLRNAAYIQKFLNQIVVRDIASATTNSGRIFFGTDGDVGMGFNATTGGLVVEPEGCFVDVRGLNMGGDRIELQERFELLPQTNGSFAAGLNPNFEVLGGNASDDDVTRYAEGGLILETDGGANTTDSVILLPHLASGQSSWTGITWGTDESVRWECVIRTGTTAQSVTGTIIWAGLKLTNVDTIATDNDSVFFRSDATNWQTNYSIGGTDTTADAVAIAQNTNYHLVIEIDSSRIARMYINGTLYATSTALTTGVDLIPYIGVRQNVNSVARRIMVVKTAISRGVGAA